MCGFAGFIDKSVINNSNIFFEETLNAMSSEISNRGPDSHGNWYDSKLGIALSHRRLSILDTSIAGNQPMFSESNRFVIVFNGEIYNHLILRKYLSETGKNFNWRSSSDTETLLACFEVFGIEKTLKLTIGMFAISLWDTIEKKLFLIRDRVGEKPLYYGMHNNCFMFASQISSLKVNPKFISTISNYALRKYLKYGYVPYPYSIYENISKLAPGSYVEINYNDLSFQSHVYWDSNHEFASRLSVPYSGTFENAVNDLDNLLTEVVTGQMISDVPLGAFLSGGIDSSTVVSIMQRNSNLKINTFTIGFNEKKYNEAEYAKEISSYLGTQHNELYIDENDAFDVVSSISSIYDEPFSDPSQIPTFILSKMTRKQVTVALSGDGGDELFCGYNRYISTLKYWKYISKIPLSFRGKIEKFVNNSNFGFLERNFDNRFNFFYNKSFTKKYFKLGEIISSNSPDDLYKRLVSQDNGVSVLLGDSFLSTQDYFDNLTNINVNHDIERFMFNDFKTYLPDDILVKLDRASMAVSLESRAPFLDKNLIEFAWSLPLQYKYQKGKGKFILRELLKKYIPETLYDRPKTGFGVPLNDWINGKLYESINTLLSNEYIVNQNLFDSKSISKIWDDHKHKRANNSSLIWNIFIFQLWYKDNFKK